MDDLATQADLFTQVLRRGTEALDLAPDSLDLSGSFCPLSPPLRTLGVKRRKMQSPSSNKQHLLPLLPSGYSYPMLGGMSSHCGEGGDRKSRGHTLCTLCPEALKGLLLSALQHDLPDDKAEKGKEMQRYKKIFRKARLSSATILITHRIVPGNIYREPARCQSFSKHFVCINSFNPHNNL